MNTAWINNKEMLDKIAGYKLFYRPSNKEFIMMTASYLNELDFLKRIVPLSLIKGNHTFCFTGRCRAAPCIMLAKKTKRSVSDHPEKQKHYGWLAHLVLSKHTFVCKSSSLCYNQNVFGSPERCICLAGRRKYTGTSIRQSTGDNRNEKSSCDRRRGFRYAGRCLCCQRRSFRGNL